MSCRVCHGFPLGRGKERSRYTRSLELIRDTATHGCESCSLLTTGVVPLLSSLGYSNEDIEKCRVGFFIPNKNTRRGAKGVCVWLQKPRRHFAVEIYTDNDRLAQKYPYIPIATHVCSRPTPEDWITKGKNWLRHCEMTHADRCPQMLQELPTRVVHVGDDFNDPYLYEASLKETGSYACLSYVWGKNQRFLTTVATFTERRKGFKLDSLPRTIRDAVVFTRGLGLKYLWVDSICIIQDSVPDWSKESTKMCSVYSKAAVTFAAVDSPDSDTGLFIGGSNRSLTQIGTPDGPVYFRSHNHGAPGSEPHPQNLPPFDNLEPPILATRGWTLQELMLSPRVLWCRYSELGWSCLSQKACECEVNPSATKQDFTDKTLDNLTLNFQLRKVPKDGMKILKLWAELVNTYMRRELTHHTDRLPALAGLAEMFQRKIGCRYMFGLWESNLKSQLLWIGGNVPGVECGNLRPNESPAMLPYEYAPSWSWASCQGQVNLWESLERGCREAGTRSDTKCPKGGENSPFEWEIKNVEIWPSGDNIFGPGRGHLTLEALVIPVEYLPENSDHGAIIMYSGDQPAFPGRNLSLCLSILGSTYGWFLFDRRLEQTQEHDLEGTELYFISANYSYVFDEDHHTLSGLLLKKSLDDDEEYYLRVGVCFDMHVDKFKSKIKSRVAFSVNNSANDLITGSLQDWERLGQRKTIVII